MGCGDDTGDVVLAYQGDAVSSHADTIRSYMGHRGAHDYSQALRSLDALLAENQRLREALVALELDRASPGWVKIIAREALTGDAE